MKSRRTEHYCFRPELEKSMTNSAAPQVECEKHHAGLAVTDVAAAVKFYTDKLGFQPAFVHGEPPAFAGMNLGQVQIFLRKGTPAPEGCVVYFVVGDADELYEFHRANGVAIVQPPTDQPHGLREYVVQDLHGYFLCFAHHLFNTGPAIEIERVDVPLRLEKRLAALLYDLARDKRMSLSSCLEEILLHTNDGVGPHTQSTLRHIQALKLKHGIDYDSHGSYRFVERQ